ncbi:MAG: TonB C-terminal domain-containing protein [Hyphomicrobiales bacterium]
MRWSLTTSLVLHGAILAAALIVLPRPEPFKVKPQDAIEVDISKIEDVSKRKATTKAAEVPKEKPAPKKTEEVKKAEPAPEVAEEVKKAAKEPEAAPPKSEAKMEEPKKDATKPLDTAALADTLKTLEEKPPEKKPEEKKPEKKTEKKPEKKKPKLDIDQIAAFLDKTDEEKAAPEQPSELAAEPEQGEANLQGTDERLAATFVEALVQRIRECWTVPPGAREANIVVKVRFGLNPDGSVIGFPEVQNPSSDPLFDATARSAVAAVMECQFYSFLPQDKYDLWKDLIINFNPNMMFDS